MDFHHMFTSHIKCRWSIWWAKIPSFDPKGLYKGKKLIWCQSEIDLGEMPKGPTTLLLVEVGLHKNTMYGLFRTPKWMADAPLFILIFTLSATKFHGTYLFWKGGCIFSTAYVSTVLKWHSWNQIVKAIAASKHGCHLEVAYIGYSFMWYARIRCYFC